uniref:hypothetical protein n=1 Tax=Alistipes sp. TaxID=1872444 RepID=UPI004055EC79
MLKFVQYESPLLEVVDVAVEEGFALSNEGYGNGGMMDLSLDPGPRDYVFLEEDNY